LEIGRAGRGGRLKEKKEEKGKTLRTLVNHQDRWRTRGWEESDKRKNHKREKVLSHRRFNILLADWEGEGKSLSRY